MLARTWSKGNPVLPAVGGNINWCSHWEKQYGGSLVVLYKNIIDLYMLIF